MPQKQKKKTRAKVASTKVPKRTIGKKQTAPAAISRPTKTRNPVFLRRDNSVIIRHCEYFEPVGTPGGVAGQFWVDSFAINPGNTSVFPWLSTQAFAWERYRFRRLQFRYVPRVATSQSGTLVLAPDYDADDDVPPNELVACSYADAVTCAPWQEVTLECNNEAMLGGMKTKYVKVGALKKNNDVKMYDAMNLFVCRDSANSTAVVWGKLWVEYEVEFLTPHTIPTPLTSTYFGLNSDGLIPAYPVPPETVAIYGANIEKAGPLPLTDDGTVVGNGAKGWKLDGLLPGARYLIQALARSAGVTPWVYTSAPPTLESGLTLVADLVGTITHTMTGADKRMLMNDLVVLATERTGILKTNWSTSGSSVLDAVQLIVSPIVSDPAFIAM